MVFRKKCSSSWAKLCNSTWYSIQGNIEIEKKKADTRVKQKQKTKQKTWTVSWKMLRKRNKNRQLQYCECYWKRENGKTQSENTRKYIDHVQSGMLNANTKFNETEWDRYRNRYNVCVHVHANGTYTKHKYTSFSPIFNPQWWDFFLFSLQLVLLLLLQLITQCTILYMNVHLMQLQDKKTTFHIYFRLITTDAKSSSNSPESNPNKQTIESCRNQLKESKEEGDDETKMRKRKRERERKQKNGKNCYLTKIGICVLFDGDGIQVAHFAWKNLSEEVCADGIFTSLFAIINPQCMNTIETEDDGCFEGYTIFEQVQNTNSQHTHTHHRTRQNRITKFLHKSRTSVPKAWFWVKRFSSIHFMYNLSYEQGFRVKFLFYRTYLSHWIAIKSR